MNAPAARPHIYLTRRPVDGLLSLPGLKKTLEETPNPLYRALVNRAEEDLTAGPLLPSSSFPGRDHAQARSI